MQLICNIAPLFSSARSVAVGVLASHPVATLLPALYQAGPQRRLSNRNSMTKSIAEIMTGNRQSGRGFDRMGQPRALSEKEFFEISDELGCNQRNEDYRRLHEHLAMWIRNSLEISSVLEIGTGPGYLLYCLNKLGIDSIGVDGNEFSRAFFTQHHPEYSDRYVLDKFFEKKYSRADAVVSIETFEHIPDQGLHGILTKVRSDIAPKCIVFSSTPHVDPNPGWDLQWGHINIKQPDEWHALFRQYGYELTTARPPVTEWASLYVDAR